MSCERISERTADRLMGALDESEAAVLRDHLAGCPGCAAESAALERLWNDLGETADAEPSAALAARFNALLDSEIERAVERPRLLAFERRALLPRRSAPSGPFAAVAAALALLALGLLVGSQLASRGQEREMAALQREVRSLHETVALALLAERSPSERLRGVAYGREFSAQDDRVAAALFETLLSDPNVNVRLAALDALRPRARRTADRPRLVAAVSQQESALVQLSLVDLLVESDEAAAEQDLAQLVANPNLDPVVRGYLRDRIGRSL